MKFTAALMALAGVNAQGEFVDSAVAGGCTKCVWQAAHTTEVDALNVLRFPDPYRFTSFEDAANNLLEWSSKITYVDLTSTSFRTPGKADDMRDFYTGEDVKTITVSPCEMLVFQVTMPHNFASDWTVEQTYELDYYAWVDALQIRGDADDGAPANRFRGAYAMRFPCSAQPKQTFAYDEYERHTFGIYHNANSVDAGKANGWEHMIAYDFVVADPTSVLPEGSNMFLYLAIVVVAAAAGYFILQ